MCHLRWSKASILDKTLTSTQAVSPGRTKSMSISTAHQNLWRRMVVASKITQPSEISPTMWTLLQRNNSLRTVWGEPYKTSQWKEVSKFHSSNRYPHQDSKHMAMSMNALLVFETCSISIQWELWKRKPSTRFRLAMPAATVVREEIWWPLTNSRTRTPSINIRATTVLSICLCLICDARALRFLKVRLHISQPTLCYLTQPIQASTPRTFCHLLPRFKRLLIIRHSKRTRTWRENITQFPASGWELGPISIYKCSH